MVKVSLNPLHCPLPLLAFPVLSHCYDLALSSRQLITSFLLWHAYCSLAVRLDYHSLSGTVAHSGQSCRIFYCEDFCLLGVTAFLYLVRLLDAKLKKKNHAYSFQWNWGFCVDWYLLFWSSSPLVSFFYDVVCLDQLCCVMIYVYHARLPFRLKTAEIFRDIVTWSWNGSCEVWCRSNKKQRPWP